MPILTSEERVGTVLDEKYRLERILGQGGMGVVYEARHLKLDRRVAVKLLNPRFFEAKEVTERFLREARATSRLSHPNVVDVRDVDVASDGCVYMVLELLDGESLASYLERKTRLDLAETLDILGPVMDALAAAHALGIVHRDVKPDNVFLSRAPDGRVVPKVLDFGIAKLADADVASKTRTGAVLGTPLYMAPEQALGHSRDVGAVSDVWSTAVMVYECLAGMPPFRFAEDAPPSAIVVIVVTGEIIPLTDVRPDLAPSVWSVLESALERSTAARLGSMKELHDGLRQASMDLAPRYRVIDTDADTLLPDHPLARVSATPETAGSSRVAAPSADASVPTLPRRPWLWAVALVAVIAIAAIGFAVTSGGSAAPATAVSPREEAPVATPPTAPPSRLPAAEPAAVTEPAPTPNDSPGPEQAELEAEVTIRRPRERRTARVEPLPSVVMESPPTTPVEPPPDEPREATSMREHRAGSVSADDFDL